MNKYMVKCIIEEKSGNEVRNFILTAKTLKKARKKFRKHKNRLNFLSIETKLWRENVDEINGVENF